MAFPLTNKISRLEFSSYNPTLMVTSLSGREQRAQVGSQKWQVEIQLENLSDADRKTLQGFFAEQNGMLSEFDFELPAALSDSSAGYTNQMFTDSATETAGSTSITIETVGAASTTVLKKGDLIRFDGKKKTYMVTDDVTTNASNLGTCNISPALQTDITGATEIYHTSVNLNVRLNEDQFVHDVGIEGFGTFAITLLEVIE